MVDYKICWVIEILMIISCLHKIEGKKFILNARTIILVISDVLILNAVDKGMIPDIASIFVYPLIAGYTFLQFGSGIKRSIIDICMMFVFLGIIQMFCTMPVTYVFQRYLDEDTMSLIIYIVAMFVYLISTHFIDLHALEEIFLKSELLLIGVMIIGTIIVVAALIMTKALAGMFFGEYITAFILIVMIFAITVSWNNYKQKAIEASSELHAYKIYEESYKNLIDEIRVRQHDFDNHLNAIYNQHTIYKTYDELVLHQQLYCNQLIADNKYKKLLRIGNSAVIGFLYGKFLEAEKKGIQIDYDIHIIELNIGIPVHKIIEILGNFINNAIDALEVYSPKRLHVQIIESNNDFVLFVDNSGEYIITEEFSNFFRKGYSKKGDGRGLGLYAIKKMSMEYEFDIICCNELIDESNMVRFGIRKNKETTKQN